MSEWTEWKWTAEKPYPETFNTSVIVKIRNGMECAYPCRVSEWGVGEKGSNWNHTHRSEYDIIAYRVVE